MNAHTCTCSNRGSRCMRAVANPSVRRSRTRGMSARRSRRWLDDIHSSRGTVMVSSATALKGGLVAEGLAARRDAPRVALLPTSGSLRCGLPGLRDDSDLAGGDVVAGALVAVLLPLA